MYTVNCRQCGAEFQAEIDYNESERLCSMTDDNGNDYNDDDLCPQCSYATEIIVKLDRNDLL